MKNLYSFYWDCGRMGSVEGLFIAAPEDLINNIGRTVYFGEILGKHSEVYGTLEEKDLELVSSDFQKVEWLEGIFNGCTISGYNPLEYTRDGDED